MLSWSVMLFSFIISIHVATAYLEGPKASSLFAAMPEGSCHEDNWGMPHQVPQQKPVAARGYYDQHIRIPCTKQFHDTEAPMSTLLPNATVIHSKSTSAYDQFVSTDWVPENKHLYGPTSSWGQPDKFSFDSVPLYSMKAGHCTSITTDMNVDTNTDRDTDIIGDRDIVTGKQDTGLAASQANEEGKKRQHDLSTWEVTRIGPMLTTGGYDWVQIGWDDAWSLSEILKTHSEGVFIMEQYMSPVFKNGTRITFPPIHIHHMHMGPSPYVRQRFDPVECLLKQTNCFNPQRTFENHGDYSCTEADGGMDCRIEKMPLGYAQLVTVPLGIEGELNDVRAPGSPVLEWYWEIGARWVPKNAPASDAVPRNYEKHGASNHKGTSYTKGKLIPQTLDTYKPLSLHNFGGPGTFDINIQKSLLFTFNIPTKFDSIYWYTGRMPIGGSLRRMKIHSHNNMFEESLVFAASPADLGMTEEAGWRVDNPHEALHPSALGFSGVQDVVTHALEHLWRSQALFDAKIQAGKEESGNMKDAWQQQQQRPQIVCQSHYALEVMNSIGYDRKCATCCVPWEWAAGQVFTVLAVNVHHHHPLGLQSPRMEDLPEYLTGHVGYWLYYDSQQSPARSNWAYNMYNHDPNGYTSALDMAGYQKVAMILNKHTSPNWNDWRQTPFSMVAIAIFWFMTHVLLGIVLILVVLCGGYRAMKTIFSVLWRQYRSDYKKNDDCFRYGDYDMDNASTSVNMHGGNHMELMAVGSGGVRAAKGYGDYSKSSGSDVNVIDDEERGKESFPLLP